MSWIDDELDATRRKSEKAETDAQRELHRAKLIDSKASEVWGLLKTECQALVDEFIAKCPEPENLVTLSDIPSAARFIIRFEHQRRTRAEVILQLTGYKIEVKHVTPTANFPVELGADDRWYLTFDTDGLQVFLKKAAVLITVARAAEKILRPVLFSEKLSG